MLPLRSVQVQNRERCITVLGMCVGFTERSITPYAIDKPADLILGFPLVSLVFIGCMLPLAGLQTCTELMSGAGD